MKLIERIALLSIFALLIQQGIFIYVEKVYLSTDLNIEADKVEEDEAITNNKLDVNITAKATNIKVSSDGRFIAYLVDDKLKVLDINDNKEKEFKSEAGSEIVFYKWLTNENNMIVIEKVRDKSKSYFEPISFNAKKGEARELADFDLNKVRIGLENTNDTVDDVVFSTATHSLYIKVKKSNEKYDLYYANVMNQLNRVKYNVVLGNVVVPTTSTNAVMEEGSNITILNKQSKVSIPNVKTAKLLGVDINDNVYLGEEVNGKIKKIYYTVLSDTKSKWNELTLKNPIEKENILIDYSGKVYVNNKSESIVSELTTNKTIKYKGDLLQSYSSGVISKVNSKLIKNNLE